jgi:hypothetical protein
VDIVDSAFHDQLLVSPDALAAHDALGEVTLDKGIDLLDDIRLGDSLIFDQTDAHLRRQLTQLAPVPLIADEAGIGVAGKHKLKDFFTVFHHPRRIGLDDHPRRDGGNAGSQQGAAAFVFDKAKPAGTGRSQVGVMAEGGDINSGFPRQIQNRCPGITADLNTV